MAVNARSSHWICTFNNPTVDAVILETFFQEQDWKYVFQMESGVNGTPHFQIYIRTGRMYCRALIRILHDHNFTWHVEVARRWKQSMLYCCKRETRVGDNFYSNIRSEVEINKVPKLVEIKRFIDTGKSMDDVMNNEQYFSSWCSHNRSLQVYLNSKIAKRNFKTLCIYVCKSRLALDIGKHLYPDREPYYKTKGQWWDLYHHEPVVIWDDFRGDCYEPQELFKLTDRYDYKVQIKGGFLIFNSDVIIFTSNYDSSSLYKDGKGEPLERRLEFKCRLVEYDGVNVLYYDCKNGNIKRND